MKQGDFCKNHLAALQKMYYTGAREREAPRGLEQCFRRPTVAPSPRE